MNLTKGSYNLLKRENQKNKKEELKVIQRVLIVASIICIGTFFSGIVVWIQYIITQRRPASELFLLMVIVLASVPCYRIFLMDIPKIAQKIVKKRFFQKEEERKILKFFITHPETKVMVSDKKLYQKKGKLVIRKNFSEHIAQPVCAASESDNRIFENNRF